jgi:hypothetical protein
VTKRALKRQLRARRKALRKDYAHNKSRVRAQLRRHPLLIKNARERRRRFWRRMGTLAAAVIVAILLFQRCSCGPPPPPPVEPTKDAGVAGRDAGVRVKTVSLTAPHLGKKHRGTLPIEPAAPPPWLEEFHLQVAARSPRLSECFRGQEKPGALRWTTAVNTQNGAVFDPEFELIGDAAWLPGQRECITDVLSKPPYHFQSPPSPSATPPRVSLVLEF